MNKIVEQLIKKELFKRGGVIASREAVQAAYDGLEARMKNLGLDINLIKTEKDYEQALGFVKSLEDQIFKKNLDDFITQKPPAKVFDLEGRQLDTQKPIIGGTQDQDEILQKSIKKNIDEATKKGDFRGIANQVLRDPEILKEFKKMKEIEALADERALQKKLIPLDTIQYQTKEIQKMTGPEKQKYLITDDKQTAELLKKL
jgi:nucleoside diphosphate kinase